MDHDDDKDWCSINEAARRLHVTPTAIRSRIKRGTLETKPNYNHGRLVRVPPTRDEPVAPTVQGTVPEAVPLTVMETVSVLSRHIKGLEAQLDEVLKRADERDEIGVEREALAARLESLKTVLEIEKQRTDEWAAADRCALQAEKPSAAHARRPWWLLRLAG